MIHDNDSIPHGIETILPPEVLVQIFGLLTLIHLGRAAQVCTYWRDVAYLKSLWRRYEMIFKDGHFSTENNYDTLIPSLVRQGITQVKLVALSCSSHLMDIFCGMPDLKSLHINPLCLLDLNDFLHPHVPPITELKIAQLIYTNRSWNKIASIFPHLVTLELELCLTSPEWDSEKMTPDQFRHLQTMTIMNGSEMTNSWLQSMSRHLLQLKHLTLGNFQRITDAGIGYLTGCHPGTDPTTPHPALESLDLSSCLGLTDLSLQYLARGQKGLRKLRISNRISSTGLSYLSQLEHLVLYYRTAVFRGLHQLTMYVPKTPVLVYGRFADLLEMGKWKHLGVELSVSEVYEKEGRHLQGLQISISSRCKRPELERALRIVPFSSMADELTSNNVTWSKFRNFQFNLV